MLFFYDSTSIITHIFSRLSIAGKELSLSAQTVPLVQHGATNAFKFNVIAEKKSTLTFHVTIQMLCQFPPNQSKHEENEYGSNLVTITHKVANHDMAMTSCHLSPLTSSAVNSGCRKV
jgi:hypothetical protein